MLVFALYVDKFWDSHLEKVFAIVVRQFKEVPVPRNVRLEIAIYVYDERFGEILEAAVCFDVVFVDSGSLTYLFYRVAKSMLQTLLNF
jgi:hypothetical protein